MHRECVPVLRPEHIVLLAKWRDAYMRGDIEALRLITDNQALVEDYAGLFRRTVSRRLVYSDMESIDAGFFAEYEAHFRYADGTARQFRGMLLFEVANDKIVGVECFEGTVADQPAPVTSPETTGRPAGGHRTEADYATCGPVAEQMPGPGGGGTQG